MGKRYFAAPKGATVDNGQRQINAEDDHSSVSDHHFDEDMFFGKPGVTLYANDQEESWQAFSVLEKARVGFAVIPAPDQQHPTVTWGGDTFVGLNEIRALIEALQEIDARLDADIKRKAIPLFSNLDPQVKREAEDAYQRQLAVARAVMASLQKTRA